MWTEGILGGFHPSLPPSGRIEEVRMCCHPTEHCGKILTLVIG